MAYRISPAARDQLAQGLVQYYDEAWTEGVRGLFDRMARANMGRVTAALDLANDTYANLKKKSADAFMVTFKAKVRQQATLYFSNAADVAGDALPLATAALEKLADMIPVPVLGTVVGKLIGLASAEGAAELRERAFNRADEQVVGASGGEVRRMFTTDEEAKEYIDNALKQYKSLGRYLGTIPANITTLQDAITFPSSIFKVQQAASSLNVALVQVRDYVESMQSRLGEVQRVFVEYRTRLETSMPATVDAVLQGAYQAGVQKGLQRLMAGKVGTVLPPELGPMTHEGAATKLAAYVTHAIAMGIYDSMSEPLPVTRGRSGAVTSRPRSGGAVPPPPSASGALPGSPASRPRPRGGA